ncbi:MAG: DUF4129 domain-containing protein [Spirochaetia bacterium]
MKGIDLLHTKNLLLKLLLIFAVISVFTLGVFISAVPVFSAHISLGQGLEAPERYPDALPESPTLPAKDIFSGFMIFLSILGIVLLIFSPEFRMKVVFTFAAGFLVFGIYMIITFTPGGTTRVAPGPADSPEHIEQPEAPPTVNPEDERTGAEVPSTQNPGFWVYAVILLFAAAAAGTGWFMHQKQRTAEEEQDDESSEFFQDAASKLSAGYKTDKTILRLYAALVEHVQSISKHAARESVTPDELGDWLVHRGYPEDAVRKLVFLFQKLRYGGRELIPEEEGSAKKALDTILQGRKG